jgi:MFS family permease
MISIVGLGIGVIAFGAASTAFAVVAAVFAGTCVAAATVGLYVTAAEVFESHVRATGTGFIVGVGRFGSAVSPAVAGGLFALGGGREGIAAVVGACAVIAGIMLAALPRQRAPGSPNRN